MAQRALTDIGALKLDEKALRPATAVFGRESKRKEDEQADHASKRAGVKLSRAERKSMSDARMRGAVLTLHYRAVLALLASGMDREGPRRLRDDRAQAECRASCATPGEYPRARLAFRSRRNGSPRGRLGRHGRRAGIRREALGTRARLLKEQAFEADTEAERVRLLVEAADVYRRVFTGPPRGSTFTGSNAAAMLMLAVERADRRRSR